MPSATRLAIATERDEPASAQPESNMIFSESKKNDIAFPWVETLHHTASVTHGTEHGGGVTGYRVDIEGSSSHTNVVQENFPTYTFLFAERTELHQLQLARQRRAVRVRANQTDPKEAAAIDCPAQPGSG